MQWSSECYAETVWQPTWCLLCSSIGFRCGELGKGEAQQLSMTDT